MTRAEAIEYGLRWKNAICDRGDTENSEAVQFLNMAIEALEQEPSEDCISRKALLEQIRREYGSGWQFVDIIENAPSVVPSRETGKWIPVSEKLPENGYWLWSATSGEVKKDFYWQGHWELAEKFGYEVVAWMPLPEPYKIEDCRESDAE